MRININTFTFPYQNTTIFGMAVKGYGDSICVFTGLHKSDHARIRRMADRPSSHIMDKITAKLDEIYKEEVSVSLGASASSEVEKVLDWLAKDNITDLSYETKDDVAYVESVDLKELTAEHSYDLLVFINCFLPESHKVSRVIFNNGEIPGLDLVNALIKDIDFDKPSGKAIDHTGYRITYNGFGRLLLENSPEGDKQIVLTPFTEEVRSKALEIDSEMMANVFIIPFVRSLNYNRLESEVTDFIVQDVAKPKVPTQTSRTKESSVRELTNAPDVRFKLPVTPVIFNCTTLQIDIENTRVVNYNNHIELRDTQYEGDPVIGVIVDFNNPISGLDNMRAIGNKNPNLPIYILWNSEEGPVLELYVE